MKTSEKSFFDHAHLIILTLTLLIACTGSTMRFKQISSDPSYAWFGYAPASIQPFVPVEYQVAPQLDDAYAQTTTNPAM
jgi:hypothetical protein